MFRFFYKEFKWIGWKKEDCIMEINPKKHRIYVSNTYNRSTRTCLLTHICRILFLIETERWKKNVGQLFSARNAIMHFQNTILMTECWSFILYLQLGAVIWANFILVDSHDRIFIRTWCYCSFQPMAFIWHSNLITFFFFHVFLFSFSFFSL